jgi:hypothetical protein
MVLFEFRFLGEVFTIIYLTVGVLMYLAGSCLIEKLAPDNAKNQLALMAGHK